MLQLALAYVIGRMNEEKTQRREGLTTKRHKEELAISTINGDLVADKLSFLSIKVRSCEISHVAANAANRVFTCDRPCTDRKCHAAIKI